MEDETLKNAFQSWDALSATHEEMLAYEARFKQVLDEEAAIREAELREKEAIAKARAKAREEGRQEGKVEVAKVMLTQGVNVETIIKYTGLDRETIEKLRQEPDH